MVVPDPVRSAALHFVQREAGFAQLVTVSRDGFPVGRTVGVAVDDDWSVPLVQRRQHRRLRQLERNPRLELVWVGSPAPGSRNDSPAVFDFGRLVPRVVFLRGVVQPMDDATLVERYDRLSRELRSRGFINAPERTSDEVRADLVGLLVRPVRVRAEGFGDGAQAHTWELS